MKFFSWHHQVVPTGQILLTLLLIHPNYSVHSDLLDDILCLHRTELIFSSGQPTLVCPWIGVCQRTSLTNLSCFSHSTEHVLLILLGQFVRWKASVHTAAVLSGVVSKIYSEQLAASLCGSHLASSPSVSLKFRWCNYTVILTQSQLGRWEQCQYIK